MTGGAGFIGSHLVEALLKRGHRVRILDNLSTGSANNVAPMMALGEFDFVHGDVRDLPTVERAMDGIEVVFHEAALPSVPRSVREPLTTNAHNVTGTLHVLDAAHRAGVRRVVYASSSSVYGDRRESPKHEEHRPAPISPYGASKAAGELYAKAWTATYGLETVGLRYFNVFGPRQEPNSDYAAVIPRFITRALKQVPLEIYGDGRQSRDFTYVDNVVQAHLAAATAPAVGGEVFNIGCGQPIALLDVVETLARLIGRTVQWHHAAARPGDIEHSHADIAQAQRRLGYTPAIDFETGLRLTLDSFAAVGTRAA